jgi:hypothetical protein
MRVLTMRDSKLSGMDNESFVPFAWGMGLSYLHGVRRSWLMALHLYGACLGWKPPHIMRTYFSRVAHYVWVHRLCM